MNVVQTTKTDFIKFNVSPEFKALAEKRAKEHGMTISELGRMLFGAFVTGVARPTYDVSPDFLALSKNAQNNHRKNLGTLITNEEELESFMASF